MPVRPRTVCVQRPSKDAAREATVWARRRVRRYWKGNVSTPAPVKKTGAGGDPSVAPAVGAHGLAKRAVADDRAAVHTSPDLHLLSVFISPFSFPLSRSLWCDPVSVACGAGAPPCDVRPTPRLSLSPRPAVANFRS